jgi:thiol-disulfide isomerase/thioredoxin
MRSWVAYILIAVCAGFTIFYFYTRFRVAPDIEFNSMALTDLQGNPVIIGNTGGKKMISFWATWCGPCREELRLLAKAGPQALTDTEIVLISEESPAVVSAFIKQSGYPFRFLLSPNTLSSLGVYSIPTSYFIDRKGTIRKKHTGFINWSDPSTLNHYKKVMD